jgi:hypothetical protein
MAPIDVEALEKKPGASSRVYALDALRGLAILGMILSGQLPFGEHALPAWMYHAQVPPPEHHWISTLPGITWVDLVFPFFIFAMGAAIPLALSRRLERGLLLGFLALYVQAVRPFVISEHPSGAIWWVALLGFALLFAVLARLPGGWPAAWRRGIRGLGWLGALGLLALSRYPDGRGFSLERSDIIIVVLANLAVFGSLLWWLTRANLLLRLGVLGVLVAFRLSNMPQPIPGWVSEVWRWSPVPWIYKLYYLQYLCILIPGTVVGDLLLAQQRGLSSSSVTPASVPKPWRPWRLLAIAGLMLALLLLLVGGLKARWLVGTTLGTFALCGLGFWLMAAPAPSRELLLRKLFNWAIYWLVLGLLFEPYEGGIKKDRATLSYYFVASGLAICVLIGFLIGLEFFRRRGWVQLLVDNGQNPMLAYAGINNLILPLLAITGVSELLSRLAGSPWLGFVRGAIITLFLALAVSLFTKAKVFWRS